MAETIPIPRGEEFPRTFVPADADLGDWAQIEPLFDRLEQGAAGSREELEDWLLACSEVEACIDEEGSRRYVAMTCHTDDPEHENAYLHFIENIIPNAKPRWQKLKELLLENQHREELDRERYFVLTRDVENDVKLFRDENIPLMTEDEKLKQQYQKICGAMTVEFDGKEQTLPQMSRYLEETDRDVRHTAWEATSNRRMNDAEGLEDILEQMLELRLQIGTNAGFESYRDYIFREKGRFDYTPEDCVEFQNTVEALWVPLMRDMYDRKRQSLGVDSLRQWDLVVDPRGRPPLRPFKNADELNNGCAEIFGKVDPSFAEYFAKIKNLGLLDLESRKGKAPGGYSTGLHEIRLPFIFMNAAGMNTDVFTLLHEGGHAFHTLLCRDDPLTHYRHAPLEFCEVASMGTEILSLDFLGAFYNDEDASRARRDHLEGIIRIMPWIARVDAYQHWLYTHPGHSRDDRKEFWLELDRRFGEPVDWSGYEVWQGLFWQKQLHIFEVPFYYIEYGIAQLGALQLWKRYREDRRDAIEQLTRGLALGGSRPLPELYSAAGLKFEFGESMMKPLVEMLEEELDRLPE